MFSAGKPVTLKCTNPAYFRLRSLYRRYLERHLALSWMVRQRLKLLWFGRGYAVLLQVPALSWSERLWLIWRYIRIDLKVPHGHEQRDCAITVVALGARRARPGEVMIEAGCWQGGSTAKWSLACRLLGYQLHVYDSFRGVEARTDMEGSYDYTGEYSATFDTVRDHVARYGDLSLCTFHPGWFTDTMTPGSVPGPVRLVYIDCDLAKGTQEVLAGVVPVLSDDGVIISEDCQIPVVAKLLAAPATWAALGVRVTSALRYSLHIGIFHVTRASRASSQ